MSATLKIGPEECAVLHRLLIRRFVLASEIELGELAGRDGLSVAELCESFGDDLRLFDEVGLRFLGGGEEPKGAELTMPAGRLAATIGRLLEDARRAPREARLKHEALEADAERRERFVAAAKTCEELLDALGFGEGRQR